MSRIRPWRSIGANLDGREIYARRPRLPLRTRGSSLSRTSPNSRIKLAGKIYGIEPGNDGNRLILDMIKDDKFGLKGWEVVESSEQGMLSQVERATKRQGAYRLPRLGAPPDEHQVQDRLSERRRRCVRAEFRRRDGLHQRARRSRRKACPNRRQADRTISSSRSGWRTRSWVRSCSTASEPDKAATDWLKANPAVLDAWLDGRHDDRRPAGRCHRQAEPVALRSSLGLPPAMPFSPWRRRGPKG